VKVHDVPSGELGDPRLVDAEVGARVVGGFGPRVPGDPEDLAHLELAVLASCENSRIGPYLRYENEP